MNFRRITRRLLMLLAASALLLGIPAAATAFASSATSGTGWIRLAHLSPNTPAVDVYLYSFDNSKAMIVLHHVAYGTVSPYESVQVGDYSVAMRAAGASATSQPVLSTSVTIAAGHAYTVAGMGPESGLRLQVLDDKLTTAPGQAEVRVIQASLKQQEVKVTLGSTVLAGSLKFGTVSDYQPVSPGTHTVTVSAGGTGTRTRASRSPPAPSTRWSYSTAPAGWRSSTWRTRRAAASRRWAASRRASAAPRRTDRARPCRGWWPSEPVRCSPSPAGCGCGVTVS